MRTLASIQQIKELNPIPDADRIEAATILGWKVVVKKGEFKPGDLCVFFEIDSVIPFNPWNAFLDKKGNQGPIRLKTVKMKKQLSQGLALPISMIQQLNGLSLADGQDVTDVLGVTKYEPPPPSAQLMGLARGNRPSWIPMTDEIRVQSAPGVLQEFAGKPVYITQKIDGSSGSFGLSGGDFHVCSRNLSLKPGTAAFWKVAEKYKIEELLRSLGHDTIIQGEVAGPGIQANRLGLKEIDLFVFNVIEVMDRRRYGYQEIRDFCLAHDLKMVPVTYTGDFTWTTVDELLELARGSYPNGHPQEGIVVRPHTPFYSNAVEGSASFKVVNNEFLLKIGE